MQVFDKIKDRILYHSDETKYRYEIGKAVIDECVKDIIKDLGLENNGWIPCSETLPDDNANLVLVVVNGKPTNSITFKNALELAIYDEEDGWILEHYPEAKDIDVIAWQPLPEPYQQKGE